MTVLVHPVRRSNLATASTDIVSNFYLNAFYAGDGVVVYRAAVRRVRPPAL